MIEQENNKNKNSANCFIIKNLIVRYYVLFAVNAV
jgi:hypothetical protein